MIPRLAASVMRRPRHSTLIFHRVPRERDPMSPTEPDAVWFRGLIRMLAANFELISLSEALRRAEADALSGRTVSITFDDGYADNFLVALPILEEFCAPATFFVASGFIDGGRMWNDSIIETVRRLPSGVHEVPDFDAGPVALSDWDSRRAAASAIITAWKHLPPSERQSRVDALAALAAGLPDDLMMSRQQLRALGQSPCAVIGGHTQTHPILATLDEAQARDEIQGGKRDLEEWLQAEVSLFAYPNGKRGRDYLPAHAGIVQAAGFSAAVATDWGVMTADSDRFAIPRFTPWHTDLGRFAIDLARCHHGLIG